MRALCISVLLLTGVGAGLGTAAGGAARGTQGNPIRIGLVGSMFRDVPGPMVQALMGPFRSLMVEQTGLTGELVIGGDALGLARDLETNKVQLVVMHGVEFAWAKEKYPDLRPLVIAINRHRHLRANLVVRDDSTAADLADLKGKALSLPLRTREHCHLFLDQQCRSAGVQPADFFGQVVSHATVGAALDDVVRGKVQAVLVDGVSLESYGQVKSGCFARLKTIKQSPVFPAAVVAYHRGALDEATLARFRDGMIRANQNPQSRDLMSTWGLSAFEPIPADYERTLADIRKAFPAPQPTKAN